MSAGRGRRARRAGGIVDHRAHLRGRMVEVGLRPAALGRIDLDVAADAASARSRRGRSSPGVMKSRLPEYAVAMTGLPSAMHSASGRPKPSLRCSDT